LNPKPNHPDPVSPKSTPRQRRNAVIAIACAAIIQVIGQLLIKRGSADLGENATLVQTAIGMIAIPYLFAGYACYGLFTVIMVLALKHAELSLLYPIMSMTYVWLPLISVLWLGEPINMTIIAGIMVITTGIAVLGKGEKAA
jgi:multidrug transporter EmrE-like cation transporter